MTEHLSECGTFTATSNEDTFGIGMCAHRWLQAVQCISEDERLQHCWDKLTCTSDSW